MEVRASSFFHRLLCPVFCVLLELVVLVQEIDANPFLGVLLTVSALSLEGPNVVCWYFRSFFSIEHSTLLSLIQTFQPRCTNYVWNKACEWALCM